MEADIGRYKRVIGDALRSRTGGRQITEVAIAAASLNCMLELGRPEYVRLTYMSLRRADSARLLIRATKRQESANKRAAQHRLFFSQIEFSATI